MSKRFRKMLAFFCCLVMTTSLMPVSFAAENDTIENAEANETLTALFGTPELGSNDPLWAQTKDYPINKSTIPGDPRPHATGTAQILWDNEYLYSRVVVEDSNVYQGSGPNHTYDSLEFYVGPGSSGSNQWRVSTTGVFSGQSDTNRAAWTQITDTGYIVEMRIPKRNLTLQPGKLTFEVYINNSTETGGDRYEVVSAFGDPDTGFNSDAAFTDSLELIEASEEDTRHSITLLTDTGGQITPNAPGNVLRVTPRSDITFKLVPNNGKVVDIVTVNSEPVTISSDNTFSVTNIETDLNIHMTFKDDSAADQLPFIVWNDNFARGEYTTAVIIDLGEGKEAVGSALHPGLFTISARDTTFSGDSVVFEGTRKIARVYANNEPKVRGYLGKAHNSPDYQEGLESGRYIVAELEFYTEVGGNTTLDGSNSTKQNYNIVQKGDIVLTEGDPFRNTVFKQEKVVNPILDKFTAHTSDSVNYALYLHQDEEGEVLQGMPLYIYTHGFSRGGTQAHIDQKASMKSANGSVALMKKMEKDPDKYASHILNISFSGGSAPQIGDVKKIIDNMVANGLVDPSRIYASGFSMGAMFTNTLINTYPDFFAAAAPLGIASGGPSASANEAHKDLAYWILVNAYDTRVNASQLDNFIKNDIPNLTNARASRFESNEALTWPYNQFDQPNQRPNPNTTPPLRDYIAHEVEAAVLYNEINMENPFTKTTWSMAPIAQSPNLPSWDNDYTDVFDWMYSQSKQMVLPDASTASYGTPELGSNDPLWSKTTEYPINKSTVPGDSRPHATGTAKILWDNDYLYSRVVVQDSNVYQGPGGDHTYDSLEFYVGPGSNGSNQWRVSSTGIYSGQSHTDRAAWTQITETGYIVEMRIPKRDLILEPGKFTFDIYINNSSEKGADRYEVVSAFGDPDTGYGSDAAFRDSLMLIEADEVDTRFSISIQADTGGKITPNAPGNVLRMEKGEDITFTITPNQGNVVDTVTVDGKAVNISSDNTFSLTNIRADHEIRVTFKDDPAADQLPFIVWNDNFASGEYTTAVIIDLGEGKEALGSKLQAGLFNVLAKNTTLVGDQLVFEGTRKISRVYANNEPKVRGYVGKVSNSPDYQAGLESGRYIVVELEFYTEAGGRTTLDGSSNSTKQSYSIVQKGDIVLTKGGSLNNAVFKQTNVVNPILDKFTTRTKDSFNYALYLHEDGKGEALQGMPLYVYTHGMSRGGTQSKIDQKASMKSANGSVALMKNMEKDPSKYASHILNISYNGTSTPKTDDVKKVIDDLVAEGLVDPNRIYVAGFSWGGAYTNTLINTYPGFFAAGAPMAPVFGSPEASVNEAHKDLAYWIFVNTHNVGGYQTNLNNFINNNMPKMTNARASRFENNEALTWPYNQFDQPNQRPNPNNNPPLPDYIAHEVEAAVLYNQITMGNWSIAPTAQSSNLSAWNNDYTDVFDWMFSQRKPGVPDAPSSFTATAGDKQVTLKWTAPANDGGSTILSYKVWYGDKTPITVDKSTYEYTFTGLTNNQEYTFKIVAVTAKGDSAEKSVTATPKQTSTQNPNPSPSPTPTPTPSNPTVPKPSGDNTNNTGTVTDTGSSKPTYTVNTPKDKPAVTDKNGITTLPGGGEIVTKEGTKIEVPKGTTIDSNGKIVVGSAGASVSLENGVSLNIQKGTELVLDDDTALGFIVVSGNPFNDVNDDNWFYSYVNFAYSFNLFNGTTSTTFSPETAMTRAMFVQALANLENVNRSGGASSRFNDVPKDQWYTAAVEWAAEKGIVSGISADQFKPNSTVSREQILVILYNYMKYKGFEIPKSQTMSFADESEISSWALEAVQALQGIGIVSGKPGNLFDHNANATRAEVATIFTRFVEYLAK
ncbi:S-layer homology domain-containing protein [Paenibacillus polygoni]|uniref:S-layer homology domain-containing protein n=1 Tax=Paenibacillus polygoni TaxID=3050112 RepID=A0ABY8X9H4_9BACL|nr:sugar-binding protein [Paenibacillus polygoni]WIV20126.1 S-layer homology domain-containing protein [Paenibacillus polygoni]